MRTTSCIWKAFQTFIIAITFIFSSPLYGVELLAAQNERPEPPRVPQNIVPTPIATTTPTPTDIPVPTKILHKVPAEVPTPVATPTPTQAPTSSPTDTPVVTEVPTPSLRPVQIEFLNPHDGSTVEGVAEIGIKIDGGGILGVGLFFKRVESLTALYIGEATARGNSNVWGYMWDTRGSPNGQYAVFAKVRQSFGEVTGSSISLAINNAAKDESLEQKGQKIVEKVEEVRNNAEEAQQKAEEKKEEVKEVLGKILDQIIPSPKAEEVEKEVEKAPVIGGSVSMPEEKKLQEIRGEVEKKSDDLKEKISDQQIQVSETDKEKIEAIKQQVKDKVEELAEAVRERYAASSSLEEKNIQRAQAEEKAKIAKQVVDKLEQASQKNLQHEIEEKIQPVQEGEKKVEVPVGRVLAEKKSIFAEAEVEKQKFASEQKQLENNLVQKDERVRAVKEETAKHFEDALGVVTAVQGGEQTSRVGEGAKNVGSAVGSYIDQYENFVGVQEQEKIAREKEVARDSDRDGITDKEEVALGLNPANPDSDGDGFLDGVEIASGSNPADASLSSKIEYEDPRNVKPKEEENYKVDRVEVTSSPEGRQGLRFEGQGLPNSFVTLYIFSTPTVVVTKTDELGRWVYILEAPVESGNHEVYVAVNSTDGKVLARSEGFFFIKTASAVAAVNPYIEASLRSPAQELERPTFVFLAIIILLSLALGGVIIGYYAKYTPKLTKKE